MNDLSGIDMALPAALSCTSDQLGDAGVPGTWANVQTILDNTCATGLCHFPGYYRGVGLDLTHGHAYGNLVNGAPADPDNQCGGTIVTPGRPDKSYLLVKLTTNFAGGGVCTPVNPAASGLPATTTQCNATGSGMPVGEPYSCPIDDCQIDIFRRWIAAGAPP